MKRTRPLVAIIDDEKDIILFLTMALSDHGFDVVGSSTSAGAIEFLEEHQPDLICLDLLMPRRTGAGLYHEISGNENLRDCPIVIISGLGVRSELEEMIRESGDMVAPVRCIEKPINIGEIVRLINELLERAGEEV